MNPSPHKISQEQLDLLIKLTHVRYMVALFILFGMISVAMGSIFLALGFRKTGFFFIGIYGALMSFLGVGFCYIFGPVVLIASLAGIAREWFLSPSKPVRGVARA